MTHSASTNYAIHADVNYCQRVSLYCEYRFCCIYTQRVSSIKKYAYVDKLVMYLIIVFIQI